MRYPLAPVSIAVLIVSLATGQTKSNDLLVRHYTEGKRLSYRMNAVNESWRYQIEADGIVKKDQDGRYYEDYRWSHFVSDGKPIQLTPAGLEFRQVLSLDPRINPSLPDLRRTDFRLIGPITDLLTFYVDLWLANTHGHLAPAGDHFSFSRGAPNSWADGKHVLFGENAIVFNGELQDVDLGHHTATLVVHHVPPQEVEVKLPASWMHQAVEDTPNNWVEVRRTQDGKYTAAVGKETFDDVIKVSLADGKILSGTIDNPVITVVRECDDAALTKCGDPKSHPIDRHVEIVLVQ
jgi:hypothetical protein